MELIDIIKTIPTLTFTIKIVSVGILGILYIFLCSIYSELKLFRNKDFIFLGFSLPALGFVITTAIGTNIALSLGMVGALSIIRFRTPVRSPYELIIYFALLTMGITMTVNFRYTFILFLVLVLFKLIYHLMSNKLSKYFISNKSQSGNIRCNFTILIKKNELSDFINKDDYMQLSCDSLNDEEVEMNISKSFKNKDEFERYLNNNKTLIKNFIVDES